MSSDPRRNAPSPSSSSSFTSSFTRHPNAQEDETWLEFLRTAEGAASASSRPSPLDRSYSADRKRRHAGSEPEGRDYPYPPVQGRSSDPRLTGSNTASLSQRQGASRETAINFTAPSHEARQYMSRSIDGSMLGSRRASEVRPPKWQPDTEVNKCPVCSQDFSFWYRKHHCRKCGRVVCSGCSPHRITIPRQYIVQPPMMYHEDEASPTTPPGSGGNLGGGEVVRVCNPCVPDPWTPSSYSAGTNAPAAARAVREVHLQPSTDPRVLALDSRPPGSASGDRDIPERYRYLTTGGSGRIRSNTHQATPTLSRDPRSDFSAMTATSNNGPAYDVFSSRINTVDRHRHSYSSLDHSIPQRPSNSSRTPAPAPAPELAPRATRVAAIPPRRQVREEDECPVCGIEMPPGDSVRETHIQECINTRFSSTPVQPSRPLPDVPHATSLPATGFFGISTPGSAVPPAVPGGSRPRATSYRPRGMALYKATEKDCITESGEAQECVICFDEFQPGDELGRMECLCKFHRMCIRQWWDMKGTGCCPTHQLHEA